MKIKYGESPEISMVSTISDAILLDCGYGVGLGSTAGTATEFWFCLPPVTLSKGFTIKVENIYGEVMVKSISSSKTIERNTFYSMPAVEFEVTGIPVPEAVDLGLRAKWASFNVGASRPEEWGDYYAWGETETHTASDYNWFWDNYKWLNYASKNWTKYNSIPSNGSVDNKSILDPEDDVAHVKLGGDWRMPTADECFELRDNCNWTFTTLNGVDGVKITSKVPGFTDKWIFLPAAPTKYETYFLNETAYWSSSPYYLDGSGFAYVIDFHCSGRIFPNGFDVCCCGCPIRPVYAKNIGVSSVSLNKNSINLKWSETATLTASFSPSNATNKGIIWQSSDTSIASVDINGSVLACNNGTATITAFADNGTKTASCTVTVSGAPEPEDFKAVDLGLSVKWANCNLSANKSNECGFYYAWGEVETKQDYSLETYKWKNLTKYNSIDGKEVLDAEDDAAHVALGGGWRIPTTDEFIELWDNCEHKWVCLGGFYGYMLTSKKQGFTDKWIFLPAAGFASGKLSGMIGTGRYWPSNNYDGISYSAYGLYFEKEDFNFILGAKYEGYSIRPVLCAN